MRTRFSGQCHCREVAVVERFKQEVMYGTKKVAVLERWPLVEGRLYMERGTMRFECLTQENIDPGQCSYSDARHPGTQAHGGLESSVGKKMATDTFTHNF